MKMNRPASWKLVAALALLLGVASAAVAQTASNNQVPAVTIQATDPYGTWTGDPAVFTVFRTGDLTPALNVYCCISGTASNGVDYKSIGNFVQLAAGVWSNSIVIRPINLGQTNVRTVFVDLCPSPMLNPVNYRIGSPSNAVVYLAPAVAPVVGIVSPTNGQAFTAPASISLIAKASDQYATVTNVEFFAGSTDLGRGLLLVLDPPGVNGVTGPVYVFNWQDVPAKAYALTAVASDNGGLSTTSSVVNITVLPLTNLPPVVRIIGPPSGSVFRAPVQIPIYAYAADPDAPVASVEFFAGNLSLGYGRPVTAVPPPLPPGTVQPPILIVAPTNYWDFIWTNPPPGTNLALTALATDTTGLSTTSAPVLVSILPPLPPPTNKPAVVTIVATDPVAIAGTNCWTWPGLVSPATWSNWVAPTAIWRLYTNCGPNDAIFTVFRSGATNNSLTVDYAIGGTATNGVGYVAIPGAVTISAGQTRADITIVPLAASPPELIRSVILTLVADPTGTNYLPGHPRSAAALILDSQSPRPVTGVTPGVGFNLAVAGPDGAWFHVEYSSDLQNWTPICTNQVVNGTVDFVDPEATANPGRFYRTVPEAGPPPQ